MTTPKPTLILVHGAYHSPATYDPILPLLHAAGYRTTTVTLPSIGSSPGHTDNLADVEAARKVISAVVVELGHEAVVVSHSYGGVIASEAVQGLKLGQNTTEALKDITPEEEANQAVQIIDMKPDGTTIVQNPIESYYHDVDPVEAKYYASLLKGHPYGTFTTPLSYDGYRHIPSAYLILDDDKALPPPKQRRYVKNAGIEWVETIHSSHTPFVSQPEAVVKFIRRVAGEV
ncbi:hypothetical protein FQN52_008884 [Onygenales sp. PD_12]|nr:hypothetical protein FQN52_008884 [Onygenales sp. PD_12]